LKAVTAINELFVSALIFERRIASHQTRLNLAGICFCSERNIFVGSLFGIMPSGAVFPAEEGSPTHGQW
jgi:hypothetical protein